MWLKRYRIVQWLFISIYYKKLWLSLVLATLLIWLSQQIYSTGASQPPQLSKLSMFTEPLANHILTPGQGSFVHPHNLSFVTFLWHSCGYITYITPLGTVFRLRSLLIMVSNGDVVRYSMIKWSLNFPPLIRDVGANLLNFDHSHSHSHSHSPLILDFRNGLYYFWSTCVGWMDNLWSYMATLSQSPL